MDRDHPGEPESPACTSFLPPPSTLVLVEGTVHVWCASLDVPSTTLTALTAYLSAGEHAHAARFHFDRDRRRYIAAHAFLRDVLSRYTGISPAAIRFMLNPYGKPSLSTGHGEPPLHFNLSHSGEVALLGTAVGAEIGIDVELIRPGVIKEGIAERFFAAAEVADLQALPEKLQADAFFHCWTRKEAYIKGRGMGLSLPLDRFEVTLRPDEPARLKRVMDLPEEPEAWSMRTIVPSPGYAGALAVRSVVSQTSCWNWAPPVRQ